MSLFSEIGHGLSHLFFPQLCEGCRTPLLLQEEVLCLGCLQELPRTGFHAVPDNEAALRLAGRLPYHHVTAFCYFTDGGLLQHLLHRLKYEDRPGIGRFLGRQLGYELKAVPWAAAIDAIVPVPLHPRKEALRGYNQSALIAEGLGAALGKPVLPRGLQRTRVTESQTKKSRAERIANVRDAFRVHPKAAAAGRHILLIDDVLTTGATLEAAAAALHGLPGTAVSIAAIGLANS